MNKAVIIDYNMGNLASVAKALKQIGINYIISNSADEIESSSHLILPGVGSFKQGMNNLKELGLIEILNSEVVRNKKPFLGICLGMQLIATSGTEPQKCIGLNWIKGMVTKIETKKSQLPLPHLGWNSVNFLNEKFQNFDKKDFYFIHSYHFNVEEKDKISATFNYGQKMVAAISYKNINAVQFHPEKSQKFGLNLLKSFLNNA